MSRSSSVSCGVSTAVGSSRIRTSASRTRALMISTRCWTPTGRSSTMASGSTSNPYWSEIWRIFRRVASRLRKPRRLGGLVAQGHVFGHGEDRNQHEVLVDHADACRHRFAGALEDDRFAVDQDFAFGGVVQSVEHVHQGGLPCAVFPQEAVDLPGLYDHIDVVIGYQGSESFRDPSQFEFQNSNQSVCVRICSGAWWALQRVIQPSVRRSPWAGQAATQNAHNERAALRPAYGGRAARLAEECYLVGLASIRP